MVFHTAYAPVPTTGPSHATLLTGLDPGRHGVIRNGIPLDGQFNTLATILQDMGYQTAGFVSGYSLTHRMSGLGRGFQVYDDSWSESQLERKGDQTVDALFSWMANISRDPFFIWVHFFDPHSPYHPPEYYPRTHLEDDHSQAMESRWTDEQEKKYDQIVNNALKEKDFRVLVKDPTTIESDEMTTRAYRMLYDAEVSYVDHCIGRIFNRLMSQDLFSRTLLCVTSDHGEGFEHDYYFGHGDRLWESATRVPWIIKYPFNKHRTRICDQVALHQDLFPTVTALTKCPFRLTKTPGENLDFIIANHLPRRDPFWNTAAPPLPRKDLNHGLLIAQYDPRFKVIKNGVTGKSMMFDLREDPEETVDCSVMYPKIFQSLLSMLGAYEKTAQYPLSIDFMESEKKEQEKLKALGYIKE